MFKEKFNALVRAAKESDVAISACSVLNRMARLPGAEPFCVEPDSRTEIAGFIGSFVTGMFFDTVHPGGIHGMDDIAGIIRTNSGKIPRLHLEEGAADGI